MDFQNYWYQKNVVLWPLIPVSLLYRLGVKIRKWLYDNKFLNSQKFPATVIVVGNITVGGTGKTPLVIYIAALLKDLGLNPGIVSKGYKGSHINPTSVTENSDPRVVGDEAVHIVKKTKCPMVVAHNRSRAIEQLLQNTAIDIVISDDGLQHYGISRDIEIAVIDGARRFGNGFCLPVGPLREPINRLSTVDMIVVKGGIANKNEFEMDYEPQMLYPGLDPNQLQSLDSFKGQTVHAVTGIGNSDSFFNLLKKHGLKVIPHAYPDHYNFKSYEISFADPYPVILTEKDAVKCSQFYTKNHWVFPIQAKLPSSFKRQLIQLIKGVQHG